MSFNPQTGLVYIALGGLPDAFANWKNFVFFENHLNTGMDTAVTASVPSAEYEPYPQVNARISAWDPVKRKEVFRIDSGSGWNAGVLSTAGNLVFQGENSGEFAAYRADTGEQLWSAHANTGIMAAPITFEAAGEQYVAVVGGWGIHSGLWDGDPATNPDLDAVGRVLAYKLGADGKLPAASQVARAAPEPPELVATDSQLQRGAAIFWERCSWCHGGAAKGTGSVPDLRYASPETHQSWNAIVLQGAYLGKGMPNFGTVLTEEDALALQAYVIKQAHLLLESLGSE